MAKLKFDRCGAVFSKVVQFGKCSNCNQPQINNEVWKVNRGGADFHYCKSCAPTVPDVLCIIDNDAYPYGVTGCVNPANKS